MKKLDHICYKCLHDGISSGYCQRCINISTKNKWKPLFEPSEEHYEEYREWYK